MVLSCLFYDDHNWLVAIVSVNIEIVHVTYPAFAGFNVLNNCHHPKLSRLFQLKNFIDVI